MNYVKGDATYPISDLDGPKIIIHCCNNKRAWGAGFVLAVSKKFPEPEIVYRTKMDMKLGNMALVQVEDNIYVANLIAQDGYFSRYNRKTCFVDYDALETAFKHLLDAIVEQGMQNVSIHGPRIGAGLAGGDWTRIAAILDKCFVQNNIPVTIYDLHSVN